MPRKPIDSLRQRVDRIDEKILTLLNQRARLAVRIGYSKAASSRGRGSHQAYVPSREKGIFRRLSTLNQGPLSDEAIRSIYREIISGSRALEQELRIAYLGPEATFTHMAAREHFGSGARYLPAETIFQVFEAVERGKADYGVVPVENSSEGVVAHTLDALVDSPGKITAEVSLEIRHHLLSRSGRLADVRRILSHPQPLAQCRQWLSGNLPHTPVEEVASTARAAEQAARDAAAAAIASRLAAGRYGLEIAAANIQDRVNNVTRFLVIGSQDTASPTGDDKTSIVFSTRDEVGILYRTLKPFAENGINLIKIESRPLKGRPWEYLFFLDLQGHRREARIRRALMEVEKRCLMVKVLGSYPAWR